MPVSHLPGPLAAIAPLLPAGALADAFRVSLGNAGAVHDATGALVVLVVWAVVTVALALRTFRWE